MLRFLDKLLAVVKRDWLTAIRQRRTFALVIFTILFEVLGLFFLARAVGPQFRPEGGAYFPFLAVGLALLNFLLAGIEGFLAAVHDSQVGGSIEVMMNTSTAPFLVVLTGALSSFLGRSLHLLVYAGIALLMVPLPAHSVNILGCLVILALSIVCASSFGIIAASIQIWLQSGGAMVWLLGSMIWLFSGTMFPIDTLPPLLQKFAWLLPFTHSLTGLRLALLHNASFSALAAPILSLGGFALALYPLSIFIFSRAIRHARQRGTLAFY